ncbi:MAG: DUF1573 domain-containing protein [Saprospiraceae bacterium]
MEKSKQIQIGLLGVIAVALLINLFGGFDSLFGGGDDAKKADARASLSTNAAVANPAADAPNKAVAPVVPAGPTTTMSFEETEFDFGTVDAGEKVTHIYKFKNTGDEPLIISNAKGSCGCTVPDWPKDPIAVGSTGEIKVVFDSKNKPGNQTKRVTVTANTDPPQSYLTIKGVVNKDPNAPAPQKPAAPAMPAN